MASKTRPRRDATRTERRQAALHRRRQMAVARTAAARRATRRKRGLRILAGMAAVAVVGGTITFLATRPDPQPSRALHAALVPGATGVLGITSSPTTYHVIYRAESYEGAKATATTEDVEISRPFDARVFVRDGAPPGGAVRFQGRSAFAQYANYPETGNAQVAGNAPTVSLGDIRLAGSLDELVARGLFVPGERRQTLGRECQVYRTGAPLQSVKIAAPTAKDYSNACIDSSGLLLEEVSVAAGKLTQRLIATDVQVDTPLDAADFAMDGDHLGPDQGGSDVTEIDRAAAPTAGYWVLDTPPAGFTYRGRYQITASEGTSYDDVYVHGIDMVTIRQGAPDAEPDLSDSGPTRDTDLGPLGSGKVIVASIGTTVVAHPGSAGFVHVTGTVAPGQLEALAASLHQS